MEIINNDPNSKASSIILCHLVISNPSSSTNKLLKDLQPRHSAHQENECDLLPHHPIPIPSLNSQ
ncbi:hypothetical protein ACE6H2_008230 [Prunus campanulata]